MLIVGCRSSFKRWFKTKFNSPSTITKKISHSSSTSHRACYKINIMKSNFSRVKMLVEPYFPLRSEITTDIFFVFRFLTKNNVSGSSPCSQFQHYKIKCSDCQASYIGETGRNLKTRLTEHKWAMRNGDVNNHIAERHWLTNHNIDWDSAQCVTYSTNYFQWLTLESWFTNLEQTPLNRCQQLPAPYKRLIHDIKITNEPNRTT